MTEKPNILFLFTDDQRFDTIRALGNAEVLTPNLDRLSARGTVFTQAHIPCGTSGAVCMPSRAMLHSGRRLFHIEEAGERIPPEHVTLGQVFREHGYRTFGTGKWHNGTEAFNRSFAEGDEIFFGGMADHWNVPACRYDPTGAYRSRLPRCADPFHSNTVHWAVADHVHAGKHSTDLVTDAAETFLRSTDASTPFFAYVSFLAPHDPRVMPRRFLDLYDPDALKLPPNVLPEHPFDTGAIRIRDERLAGFPREPAEIRRHLAEYYAMISHLDAAIGRLLDVLEEMRILERTLIVFAGDNGLAVGQHGLMGKQNCYEHSVRVPLIFAGPGVPEGRRSDAFAYLFDVFPTLCGLAGLPVPETVEGCDLAPAMRDPDASPRETLYFAYTDVQRAVKTRRWKLIEYAVPGQPRQTQLFDLEADRWETRNLADRPEHAETVAGLRKELARLRDAWEDHQSRWGRSFWSRYHVE